MNNTNSMFSCFRRILKRNFLITNIHFSLTGMLDPGDHFHQCGFTCTILTDQNVYLSPEQVKRNVIQGFCSRINFADMVRMQKHMLRTCITHNRPSYFASSSTGVINIFSLSFAVKQPVNEMVLPSNDAGSAFCTTSSSINLLIL